MAKNMTLNARGTTQRLISHLWNRNDESISTWEGHLGRPKVGAIQMDRYIKIEVCRHSRQWR